MGSPMIPPLVMSRTIQVAPRAGGSIGLDGPVSPPARRARHYLPAALGSRMKMMKYITRTGKETDRKHGVWAMTPRWSLAERMWLRIRGTSQQTSVEAFASTDVILQNGSTRNFPISGNFTDVACHSFFLLYKSFLRNNVISTSPLSCRLRARPGLHSVVMQLSTTIIV